jgi:hypothetical protein
MCELDTFGSQIEREEFALGHIQRSGNRLLENTKLSLDVRFEVFTAATMKNGVFWDVTQCRSLSIDVSEERLQTISKH